MSGYIKRLRNLFLLGLMVITFTGCNNSTVDEISTTTGNTNISTNMPTGGMTENQIPMQTKEAESKAVLEDKTVYTFKKADPENLPNGTHNIGNVYSMETASMHSLFIGQVMTLFGEPDYMTDDYENMCSWVVEAADNDGNKIYLEIYHGPSGPAIGGTDGEDYEIAAKELTKLIMSAKATDYYWESIYYDVGFKIVMKVENGKPYYETIMSEEFESMMYEYYN